MKSITNVKFSGDEPPMINVSMKPSEVTKLSPKIAVIGVGGGGGNAVENMDLEGCDFIVCNSDAQALQNSTCKNKVQLGVGITGGLGAGSKPEVGRAAAEENLEEVMQYLEGANMAFVTAGMGGGTGTGAAPVIAKACRERGILTVGVVTKPFHFEGVNRMRAAEAGIEEMHKYVDTLIVIPNQNLFNVANEKTTFAEAFKMADGVLKSGVRGVTDLMVRPGLVNLDFADVKTAMSEMGKAMMGAGEATGDKRAVEAAEAAINNPLLDDVSLKGAQGVIINITGGYDMTLYEVDEACDRVTKEVDPEANIIFGATFDEAMEGKMRVSIVATGIEKESVMSGGITGAGASGVFKPSGGGISAQSMASSIAAQNTQKTTNFKAPVRTEANTSDYIQRPQVAARSSVQAQSQPAPEVKMATPAVSTSMSMPAPTVEASIEVEQEQSLDMFEQGEFVAQVGGSVDDLGESAYSPTLRGTRYKNAFIPPQPIRPERDENEAHITTTGGFHAHRSVAPAATGAGTSSGLKLNPPKLPTPKERRTQSLFERITGSVQQKLEEIREEYSPKHAEDAKGQGFGSNVVPESSSQKSLDIDSPSKAGGDSDLDIPAFLRRQAN